MIAGIIETCFYNPACDSLPPQVGVDSYVCDDKVRTILQIIQLAEFTVYPGLEAVFSGIMRHLNLFQFDIH